MADNMRQQYDLKIFAISLGRRGGFPLYGYEMTNALAGVCDTSALYAAGADNIDMWRSLTCRKLEVSTYNSSISGALSFFNVPKFLSIRKFILAYRPDVIYYTGGHYWKPVLDLITPRGIPTAMTVHDPFPHPGDTPFASKVISSLDRKRPDAYILLNDTQKEQFAKANDIPKDKILVIPHGVFSGYRAARQKLGDFADFAPLASRGRDYMLFVGRIVKYKGIETMLRAYAEAGIDRPLVIAGSGAFSDAEQAAMRDIPPDRLIVINKWLSDAEIATLTAEAYMTILPYEGATQSGVIPMSAAFGTPSIASDSGGLGEQIIDGTTGFVFPSGSADKLRERFIEASRMPVPTYEKMRRAAYDNAETNWGWPNLASRLASFLGGIVHR